MPSNIKYGGMKLMPIDRGEIRNILRSVAKRIDRAANITCIIEYKAGGGYVRSSRTSDRDIAFLLEKTLQEMKNF